MAVIAVSFLCQSCDSHKKVYICTGPSSECYHVSDECIGLRNCGSDTKKVSISKARENGRRPCKLCCEDR